MHKIAYNSFQVNQIYPKFDAGIYLPLDPQYVYQISARLKFAYMSYV